MKKTDLTLVCRQHKTLKCNFRIVLKGYCTFRYLFILFNLMKSIVNRMIWVEYTIIGKVDMYI